MEKAKLIEALTVAQASNRRAEVTRADLDAHADKAGHGWWKVGAFTVYEKHDSTAPIETGTWYSVAAPKKAFVRGEGRLLTTPEEDFGASDKGDRGEPA